MPLQIEGEQIAARIVGVIRRFPSTTGEAIVADRTAAATELDTQFPGLGQTNELWANVPSSGQRQAAATLAKKPFDILAVASASRGPWLRYAATRWLVAHS